MSDNGSTVSCSLVLDYKKTLSGIRLTHVVLKPYNILGMIDLSVFHLSFELAAIYIVVDIWLHNVLFSLVKGCCIIFVLLEKEKNLNSSNFVVYLSKQRFVVKKSYFV